MPLASCSRIFTNWKVAYRQRHFEHRERNTWGAPWHPSLAAAAVAATLMAARGVGQQKQRGWGKPRSSLEHLVSIIDSGDLTVEDIETLNEQLTTKLAKEDAADSLTYVKPGDENSLMVFSCTGHHQLAQEVCAHLRVPLARMLSTTFADGEIRLKVLDDVRSKDVYVIQSFNAGKIHNELMELFFAVSCLRRASAERITAIIPYVPYSREAAEETEFCKPTVVSADIGRILHTLGVDRVLFVDHHDARATAHFPASIPVTNLIPHRLAIRYLRSKNLKQPVIVSPANDAGERAKAFWSRYSKSASEPVGMAAVATEVERSNRGAADDADTSADDSRVSFVGDVDGKDVIIVDDVVDSGRRILRAAEACAAHGARRIYAYAPHGLLRPEAVARINESPLRELIIMDTVAQKEDRELPKLKTLNISRLLSLVIRRLHDEISASGPREPLAELYHDAAHEEEVWRATYTQQ